MRQLEIVGGGLAGLGLGLALRMQGVPVTILESGDYPRHRVCGEFIAGLDRQTREALGIDPLLEKSLPAHHVTWFEADGKRIRHRLPEDAYCLSRYMLDDAMAKQFTENGGCLRTRTRGDTIARPGRFFCLGRRRFTKSPWLGLKQHFLDLETHDDLEIHFGRNTYVGITRVENRRVNVCGLFQRGQRSNKFGNTLIDHIEAAGLHSLARRLDSATSLEDSACAVAGLHYENTARKHLIPSLGDFDELIPPFTGNGMAIALQSAAIAKSELVKWSMGKIEWDQATKRIRREIHRRMHHRIVAARVMHSWLLDCNKRRMVMLLSRLGLLPFKPLYKLLH